MLNRLSVKAAVAGVGRSISRLALCASIRRASRFLSVAAMVCLTLFGVQVRAAESSQPERFLLIFETSSALKKNLPTVQQTLEKLLSNNVQNELKMGDDLAVWTVDQDLHTGGFPLASWSPDDSTMYTDRLTDFLSRQKYTRHATLAAVQPLLNRVAKTSERLTVLIFCDTQSRLLGTPYDTGVNEIITNAAVRLKGKTVPLVLVLRAFEGEYLGCSVNRTATLNFPPFPPPAKPEPPPVAGKPVPANPPAPAPAPTSGPIVTPVPAMIIVGTNASTNIPAGGISPSSQSMQTSAPPLANVTTPARPAPMTAPPAPVIPPAPSPAISPAPTAISEVPAVTSPPKPAPIAPPPTSPRTTPATSLTPTPAPQSAPSLPAPPSISSPSPVAETNLTVAAAAEPGHFSPMGLGIAALVTALAVAGISLLIRVRRPRGSLITDSMQNNPGQRK